MVLQLLDLFDNEDKEFDIWRRKRNCELNFGKFSEARAKRI